MIKVKLIGIILIFSVLASCSSLLNKSTKKQFFVNPRSEIFKNHHTGFLVVDTNGNDTLIDHNGSKYFVPASTTKLFTLYASLKLLGENIPAFDYHTDKTKLFLQGTGDPTWLHPHFKDTMAIAFLKDFDSIVVHLNNHDGEKFGPGWAWEDYAYDFSPEITPLPLYGNVVNVSQNDSLRVQPSYFSRDIALKNSVYARNLRENKFYLPPMIKDTLRIPFITSDSLTLNLLKRVVGSDITLIDSLPNIPLKTHYGIPTDALLKHMLVESDNFLAEQLMLLNSSTLSDTLSFKKARDFMVETYLNDLSTLPRWVDGSGLSRYNLFTPESMIDVLGKLLEETDADRLFSLIPQWDGQGTIHKTEKDGKDAFIFAKSGSMGNIYNLCGYLRTKSGRLLMFSFMNNHFRKPSSEIRLQMFSTLKSIHETY